jgi:hypothetical protein
LPIGAAVAGADQVAIVFQRAKGIAGGAFAARGVLGVVGDALVGLECSGAVEHGGEDRPFNPSGSVVQRGGEDHPSGGAATIRDLNSHFT